MEFIKIVFVLNDLDYGKRLASTIIENYRNILINIVALDNFESVEYENCLIISDCISLENIIDGLILDTLELDENDKKIYKYGGVDYIVSKILLLAREKLGVCKVFKKTGKTNMVSFISSGGGMGKTVVSLGIARELSKFHSKKVLYFSLEDISSLDSHFSKDKTKNLDKFLYYYGKNEDFLNILESFLVKDEFDVYTFDTGNEINLFTKMCINDFQNIIEKICNLEKFDFIIWELPSIAEEKSRWILGGSNKIVSIKVGNNNFKQHKFDNILAKIKIDDINDRLIEVYNKEPVDSVKLDNVIYEDINISKNMNLDGDFGIGIKKLSEGILGL